MRILCLQPSTEGAAQHSQDLHEHGNIHFHAVGNPVPIVAMDYARRMNALGSLISGLLLTSFSIATAQEPNAAAWLDAKALAERGIAIKHDAERWLICSATSCVWLESTDPRLKHGDDGPALAASSLATLFEVQASPAKLGVGSLLPSLQLVDLDDRPIHLGAYRGKRLLITAWASW
jgi:hypothetical protein